MSNVVVGIVWQTCLTVLPDLHCVEGRAFRSHHSGDIAYHNAYLKKNWYDKLKDDEIIDKEIRLKKNHKKKPHIA